MSKLDKIPGYLFGFMIIGIIGMAIVSISSPWFTIWSLFAIGNTCVIIGALLFGTTEEEEEELAE